MRATDLFPLILLIAATIANTQAFWRVHRVGTGEMSNTTKGGINDQLHPNSRYDQRYTHVSETIKQYFESILNYSISFLFPMHFH